MRDNLTPITRDIIKQSTNNKYWKGYGEKGPSYTLGAATMEVWGFLKKLNI